MISKSHNKDGYVIHQSVQGSRKTLVRPINTKLFINEPDDFLKAYGQFISILDEIKTNSFESSHSSLLLIDQVTYTIQQSIGAALDLVANPNSARKHVGNRFEELIKAIFTYIGISNKKIVLQIPYQSEDGQKTYKCENDLIISPYSEVRSSSKTIDKDEVVVSIKTTSKDRMGKMFIDKILLERFVGHKQKVIGIFLNDVQRKEEDNISYTLVAGLFMVYSQFLTELEGVYYLDPPPNAKKEPFNRHMGTFSRLLTEDVKSLLSP